MPIELVLMKPGRLFVLPTEVSVDRGSEYGPHLLRDMINHVALWVVVANGLKKSQIIKGRKGRGTGWEF